MPGKRTKLMLRSVRNTQPRQLVMRAWLMGKRRFLVTAASRNGGSLKKGALPLLAEALPAAIFRPRRGLVIRSDHRLQVNLAGQVRRLESPVCWHPPELAKGTRLIKLNLHYMEYLEGLTDDEFAAVLTDWIQNNPPYRSGYWLDHWNSFALSIRVVVWMQQYQERASRLPESVRAALLASLVEQIRFLESNLEDDIGGNHIIKNIKALLWAGRFFTGAEAERWTRLGERLLARELEAQILGDGIHFERSPAYHCQVFADLLETSCCVCEHTLKQRLARYLSSMAQAVCDLSHSDGRVSLFNDGGLSMTYAPAECLEAYARLTGERKFPRDRFAFTDAGYYGVRNDHGSLMIAKYGDPGPASLPAHAHGDVFSFEWTVRGRRVVVDAGVFEYDEGSAREYARSTRSHNTVTIGDHDQCEFWKSFRMARGARVRNVLHAESEGEIALEGEHDGYGRLPGAPMHRRRIVATPESIAVTDVVSGGAGQSVRSRLLIHPALDVRRTAHGALITADDLEVTLFCEYEIEIQEAVWFPDFYHKLPCRQIVITYGAAPCDGSFRLQAMARRADSRSEYEKQCARSGALKRGSGHEVLAAVNLQNPQL